MLQSPALSDGGLPASPTRRPAAGRAADRLVYALVDVSRVDDPAEAAAVATWRRYEGPLRVTEPGKYAVLTKLIPGAPPMAQADADALREDALAGGRHSDDLGNLLYETCAAESCVATAVFELGESPPLLQYEECPQELAFVARRDATGLACRKCGGEATGDRRLYAKGGFVICRACALRGAGVMVDPGARRMWFSQMISFVGNRAIPLPKSQPLLTQILRVLQAHPGMCVRFEGHVNSKCGLDCDGSKPCANAGEMCKKCPGGALGLSTARANAVRAFVLACGVESDRIYAEGFAGTRRLTGDVIDESMGHINRRVEVHTLLC